jgi:predicted NodU family carbamoyl transferase
LISEETGEILFAQAKERLSGRKHDGGGVADLVEYACEFIGAKPEDITTVVSNNHHYRVHPYERRLRFATALKYENPDNLRPSNLLSHAKHYELSHHLAHAWSVVGTCPFDKGVVLVMDGMGESFRAMVEDISGTEEHSGDYMHDLKLLKMHGGEGFVGQPTALAPGSGYREAETAYVFDRNNADAVLKPIFKRWGRERSPPELYNHGFENMESMGAVYSRISSTILGDWNACGKVMGLAPWSGKGSKDATRWGGYHNNGNDDSGNGDDHHSKYSKLGLGVKYHHAVQTMTGNPYDDTFAVNWDFLESDQLADSASDGWCDSRFDEHANLAVSCQNDLEASALALAASLQEATREEHLCITGGVGLNSVLNGRLTRESGFSGGVYVPPAPGDEGIAVGCAVYGLQRVREGKAALAAEHAAELALLTSGSDRALSKAMAMFGGSSSDLVTARTSGDEEEREGKEATEETGEEGEMRITTGLPCLQFPAYQGASYTNEQIMDAIDEYSPWISADHVTGSEEALVDLVSDDIAQGKVVGWFQGRSEFGQRALGARSILGDPRNRDVRIRINDLVKEREWWRPLAPSVLDEYAGDWFEGIRNSANESPYMSLTAQIKAVHVETLAAVSHIDGSARLQTVRAEDAPLYHKLISAFYAKTGVPMVLNTSFNRRAQPIVESPAEAIKAFLSCTAGSMDVLYLGSWLVTRRAFPLSCVDSIEACSCTLSVQAETYYRSELVSLNPNFTPLVDKGSGDGGHKSSATSTTRFRVDIGSASGDLLELPSQLHFDLLTLLQSSAPPPPSGDNGSDGDTDDSNDDGGMVVVRDLYAAMLELSTTGEQEVLEGDEEFTWKAFRQALEWLFHANLASFDDTVESDPAQVFAGADVLDLRNL